MYTLSTFIIEGKFRSSRTNLFSYPRIQISGVINDYRIHSHVSYSSTIFEVLGLSSLSTHFSSYQDGACLYRGYDNHFILMSQNRHSRIISHSVTLFQFLCGTTLYMSIVGKGSFNYQFEIFGLTVPGIEHGPPRHTADDLPLGYGTGTLLPPLIVGEYKLLYLQIVHN